MITEVGGEGNCGLDRICKQDTSHYFVQEKNILHLPLWCPYLLFLKSSLVLDLVFVLWTLLLVRSPVDIR